MANVAEEVECAAAALERVRQTLRPRLEAEPAWRAFMQLEERERLGDAISSVDRSELRDRLARDLDRRVADWRLLPAVEAALAALAAHGISWHANSSRARPSPSNVPPDHAQDDVDAILRRIRSIADGQPVPHLPSASAPPESSFADWGEPTLLSEAARSRPGPATEPVSSSKVPVPQPSLPVVRVDRIEAELDGLLQSREPAGRQSEASAMASARATPANLEPGDGRTSWSGSRHAISEEAEVEIVAMPEPPWVEAPATSPQRMLERPYREQVDRADPISEIIDEASVEIIQLDTPDRSPPR